MWGEQDRSQSIRSRKGTWRGEGTACCAVRKITVVGVLYSAAWRGQHGPLLDRCSNLWRHRLAVAVTGTQVVRDRVRTAHADGGTIRSARVALVAVRGSRAGRWAK